MQLILSSVALPSASPETVCRGARERSLAGVEWVVRGRAAEDRAVPLSEGSEEDVRWIMVGDDASTADQLYWGRQAHLCGAGLVLRAPVEEASLCAPLALQHGSDVAAAERAASWAQTHDAQTCWTVEGGTVSADRVAAVLEATGPTLAHVRLRGAGPETEAGGGDGTSALFKALALRGYSGTVALAPSAQGTGGAWRRWCFEERGLGCNTAANKAA